jgi:hypothetical protein
MDCDMGVPILSKLPEPFGVRDGYRRAFNLRSKAFTCDSNVPLSEGDASPCDSAACRDLRTISALCQPALELSSKRSPISMQGHKVARQAAGGSRLTIDDPPSLIGRNFTRALQHRYVG